MPSFAAGSSLGAPKLPTYSAWPAASQPTDSGLTKPWIVRSETTFGAAAPAAVAMAARAKLAISFVFTVSSSFLQVRRRGLQLAALDAGDDGGDLRVGGRGDARLGTLAGDEAVHRVDLRAPALEDVL